MTTNAQGGRMEELIAELDELEAKATPWPWGVAMFGDGLCVYQEKPENRSGARVAKEHTPHESDDDTRREKIVRWLGTHPERDANLRLIAALRNAWPQLRAMLTAPAAEAVAGGMRLDDLVDRFLGWPLPKSVASDPCVTDSNYPLSRCGTNLLTADEARQMLEYLLPDVLLLAVTSVETLDIPAFLRRWPDALPASPADTRETNTLSTGVPQEPHGAFRADDPNPEAQAVGAGSSAVDTRIPSHSASPSRERGVTVSVSDDRSGTGSPASTPTNTPPAAPALPEEVKEPGVLRLRNGFTVLDGEQQPTYGEYVRKDDYDAIRTIAEAARRRVGELEYQVAHREEMFNQREQLIRDLQTAAMKADDRAEKAEAALSSSAKAAREKTVEECADMVSATRAIDGANHDQLVALAQRMRALTERNP